MFSQLVLELHGPETTISELCADSLGRLATDETGGHEVMGARPPLAQVTAAITSVEHVGGFHVGEVGQAELILHGRGTLVVCRGAKCEGWSSHSERT